MDRRLAAVLIADVAGYGRLSQTDEEGTRARFQADLHEVFEPAITEHRGRLVKTMGDGVLIEFRSVVDALRCAIDVERAEAERNAAVPVGRRLEFRIGINLGDVIVEGDDIHGDGVNIADRLQSLAEPGGIVISGSAYDQVKTRVGIGYQYLGTQPVKNVSEPMRIYRVLMDPAAAGKTIIGPNAAPRSWRWPAVGAAALALVLAGGAAFWWQPWQPRSEPASVERMALPLPDKPSIAVLPFANLSDDPKQEYFADGITDDLITELSKVSGLFVISRNSAFAYKGQIVQPKKVSEELGVRYVLEGSVQRAGEQLRINAQLIDALSGGHVWADRFNGSLSNVFAFQDKVTLSIADALALRLNPVEQVALKQSETSVPAAYDAFLRGWEYLRRRTPTDLGEAVPHLEEAIKLDPNYGRAYAALAMVHFKAYDASWTFDLGVSEIEAREKAWQYLEKAKEHPTALSHQVAALLMWVDADPNDALAELKAAVELDPGDAQTYAYTGGVLTSAGRPAEAISQIQLAMRLDPHYPPFYTALLARAQFALKQFEQAAASLETATRLAPDDEYSFALLAATYGHLGRREEGSIAFSRYRALRIERGDIPPAVLGAPGLGYKTGAERLRVRQGLRLAGVPEYGFSDDFVAENKLTAAQIRELFFGRKLHGRSTWAGADHAASFTADGVVTISGNWVFGGVALTDGVAEFRGDELCYVFGTARYCGTMFRNPGGSKARENEFIWYSERGKFAFSPQD